MRRVKGGVLTRHSKTPPLVSAWLSHYLVYFDYPDWPGQWDLGLGQPKLPKQRNPKRNSAAANIVSRFVLTLVIWGLCSSPSKFTGRFACELLFVFPCIVDKNVIRSYVYVVSCDIYLYGLYYEYRGITFSK